jgi:hypothetical protein
MAIKKSELYASLWSSCDELRGGMDASQYKDYILTLLFMKYVSDKYAGDPDAIVQVPPVVRADAVEAFNAAVREALASPELTTIVTKVAAIGPKSFHMDLPLLENRFQFSRQLRTLAVRAATIRR